LKDKSKAAFKAERQAGLEKRLDKCLSKQHLKSGSGP